MAELTFTIGEAAKLVGVTPKTLRHYHEIGLVNEPERDSNNYRRYTIQQLEQLQRVLRLKDIGLSLQQIKAIIDDDNPNSLIRNVLQQHQRHIKDEIATLQNRLDTIQQVLESDINPLSDWENNTPEYSAMSIVSDTIRPVSNGLHDILFEVEGIALSKIDRYQWTQGYEIFWHQVSQHFINNLGSNERILIFWMERYIALGAMNADDLQGNAWLRDLLNSPARLFIAQIFTPPSMAILPENEQLKIQALIPTLMFEQGSTLQKKFLSILAQK
ncbi:MAG: MerR family transcriptional regulator [Phototrophicaceae bacterium]